MDPHGDGPAPDVEPYGCAVCRIPLNAYKRPGKPVAFLHPDRATADHAPDPVPLSQLPTVETVCDFCSAPNPVASFAFSSLEIIAVDENDTPAMTQDLGGNWAACEGCARLVEIRDVAGLTARAAARARRRGIPAPMETFGPLHQALFAATPTTPPRRPLHVTAQPAPPTAAPAANPSRPAAPPEVRALRPHTLPKVRDRLVKFWRTSGPAFLLAALTDGARYPIPGHMLPGAPLDAPAADIDFTNPEPLSQYTALMANHIENGRMFWVDNDFTALAAHAARDLSDVRALPAELPAPDGLLVWQTPICHVTEPEAGAVLPIIAAQWGPIPGGVWVTFYTPAETVVHGRHLTEREMQELRERIGWLAPVNTGAGLHYGKTYTPATEQSRAMLAALIATWILTTQPDAELTDEPADKATRKAYHRTNRPAPVVRLVRLRRKQQARTDAPVSATARTYTRRWWVRGFFREQPYGPRGTLRRRTYVRPHLKGPADAPLILTEQVRVLGSPTTPAQK
ncbi:hypothetical protein GA0070616_0059 [Micromonospora nigra]|uniref:Uncharacterized protein n=1 Tax=Micromonospora nigra TaxID=145857 RepID=A0A1C6R7I2_9ACTN|nr:hypothetical protein [Micromonospora nigra]SCL12904.1 hypothetical protein GA0070616_0059 [Micromonospora nigra]